MFMLFAYNETLAYTHNEKSLHKNYKWTMRYKDLILRITYTNKEPKHAALLLILWYFSIYDKNSEMNQSKGAG